MYPSLMCIALNACTCIKVVIMLVRHECELMERIPDGNVYHALEKEKVLSE